MVAATRFSPPLRSRAVSERPILAVDVDGVISLFGFDDPPDRSQARFQLIDGMVHCISLAAGERLERLSGLYDLVWATGWEDRANDSLAPLLGLPELPYLTFGGEASFGSAHWKLGPIGEYAGSRALAWIDDNFDDSCYEWAVGRPAPTLLVPTEPHLGLEEGHVAALESWAEALPPHRIRL
jgi:hypothetical protein